MHDAEFLPKPAVFSLKVGPGPTETEPLR